MADIAVLVQSDPASSYRLLRLLNSARYGLSRTVASVKEAVIILGSQQIAAWVSLTAMAGLEDVQSDAMMTAVRRGRMCEQLARENGEVGSSSYFLVGGLSTLDQVLHIPLDDIISGLPLDQAVVAGVLRREGPLGAALTVATAYEDARWEDVRRFEWSASAVRRSYLDSIVWASSFGASWLPDTSFRDTTVRLRWSPNHRCSSGGADGTIKGYMSSRDRILRPLYRLYEGRLERHLDAETVPGHIGIILDGHRRYARREGLPDYEASYRVGMRKFEEFLGWTHDLEIQAITGWLLSTHNLERPTEELEPYFSVLIDLFDRLPRKAAEQDFAVKFIGSLDLLPTEVQAAAKNLEERCIGGSRRLTLAVGYGGRQEIVDAVRELVDELADSGMSASQISEQIDIDSVQSHLYTADLPDPDVVIRTSGESRLSGFLLWQSAYAEYVFVDVYWPAFRRVDFIRSMRDFARRERRYGK